MAKNIYKYLYVYHYLRYKRYGYSNSEIYSSIYVCALITINIITLASVLLYMNVISINYLIYIHMLISFVCFIGNEIFIRKNKFFMNEIQEVTPMVKKNKYYIILYELFSVGLLLFLVWLNHK